MMTFPSKRRPTIGKRPLSQPMTWYTLAIGFLALDFVTGPNVYVSIGFVLPVALAAWHRGFSWAAPLAWGQPLASFGYSLFFENPPSASVLLVNLFVAVMLLAVVAGLVAKTAHQQREIEQLERLLLPLCICCHKIDAGHAWQSFDSYLTGRSRIHFTHCICPTCKAQTVFPEPYN